MNSQLARGSWTVSTSSFKLQELISHLEGQGVVESITIPLSLLEYDASYQFTLTYMSEDITFDLDNLKCNNASPFSNPTLLIEKLDD